MDNYIVLNGKKHDLTDEQVAAITAAGITFARNNPFERARDGLYYLPATNGEITQLHDSGSVFDKNIYAMCNGFNDAAFAKQVQLHQLLYRRLLKFAYDNGLEDTSPAFGPDACGRYYVVRVGTEVTVGCTSVTKIPGVVYFATEDGAQRAVREVVQPFLADHPGFEW